MLQLHSSATSPEVEFGNTLVEEQDTGVETQVAHMRAKGYGILPEQYRYVGTTPETSDGSLASPLSDRWMRLFGFADWPLDPGTSFWADTTKDAEKRSNVFQSIEARLAE